MKKRESKFYGKDSTFAQPYQLLNSITNTVYLQSHFSLVKQLADIKTEQDWYEVFKALKVKNTDKLYLKKISADSFVIFVNHHKNTYQRWLFTRALGLDGTFTSHANGDAWQVYTVNNYTLMQLNNTVNAIDEAMAKVGAWTDYSGVSSATATGASLTATITGTDIFVRGTFKADGGLATLNIDGVDVGTVDFYNVSTGGTNLTIPIATGLSDGDHVVKLTVSGTKNASSSGYSVRLQFLQGQSSQISNLNSVIDTPLAMPSGRNYRYGQSAIEIAINSTYNGNTVWSGTYHKYLYPKVANGQMIYIDGALTDISTFVINKFYECTDLMVTQDLTLRNVTSDIADVKLINHFNNDGYHVKWMLE